MWVLQIVYKLHFSIVRIHQCKHFSLITNYIFHVQQTMPESIGLVILSEASLSGTTVPSLLMHSEGSEQTACAGIPCHVVTSITGGLPELPTLLWQTKHDHKCFHTLHIKSWGSLLLALPLILGWPMTISTNSIWHKWNYSSFVLSFYEYESRNHMVKPWDYIYIETRKEEKEEPSGAQPSSHPWQDIRHMSEAALDPPGQLSHPAEYYLVTLIVFT